MRADIHDGQELKGSINRPDTEAQDQPSPNHYFRLATRGRSIQMGHSDILQRAKTASLFAVGPVKSVTDRPVVVQSGLPQFAVTPW